MSAQIRRAKSAAATSKIVVERTYQATVRELWELWTTKEGFESWWAPEGFRVVVYTIEACLNGELHYDMIAESPEVVTTMEGIGVPATHTDRARFSEFQPLERLVLRHVMDFLPGVEPYESQLAVDFFPSGEWTRMVVTLSPMHTKEFTKMASQGLASQFANLDKLFNHQPQ